MIRMQNSRNIRSDKVFKAVAKFQYLGTTVTDDNYILQKV